MSLGVYLVHVDSVLNDLGGSLHDGGVILEAVWTIGERVGVCLGAVWVIWGAF
jgi:hypothetical protein